jgi:hypothetical protein
VNQPDKVLDRIFVDVAHDAEDVTHDKPGHLTEEGVGVKLARLLKFNYGQVSPAAPIRKFVVILELTGRNMRRVLNLRSGFGQQ